MFISCNAGASNAGELSNSFGALYPPPCIPRGFHVDSLWTWVVVGGAISTLESRESMWIPCSFLVHVIMWFDYMVCAQMLGYIKEGIHHTFLAPPHFSSGGGLVVDKIRLNSEWLDVRYAYVIIYTIELALDEIRDILFWKLLPHESVTCDMWQWQNKGCVIAPKLPWNPGNPCGLLVDSWYM